MDKLRESGAADDPTTQQRLATDGQGGTAAAAGGEGTSDEYHHQFYNTGRIGRRNALPDILGTHCTTTTADLSSQLGSLSTSGKCVCMCVNLVRSLVQEKSRSR